MSVNIGADPAAGVHDAIRINSPGVISLNSTESPRATPTPTPQSPSVTKVSKLPPTTTVSTNTISSNAKKVIQELKPVDVVPTPAVSVANTAIEEVIQPTSPTKNYLTRFPVVKGQQKPEKTMTNQSTTPNVKAPVDKVPMASSTMTSSRETVTTKVTTSSVPSSFSSISRAEPSKHHYHSTHASHTSQQHQRVPQDYPTNPYGSQSYVDFSRQSSSYPVNTAKAPQIHSYKRPSNPPTHANPVPTNPLPSFPVQSHENMQHPGYQVMEQPDSFFSVNQLVNNPKAGQYSNASTMMGSSSASLSTSKKSSSSKRSSSSSSTSSRYQKQQRIGKLITTKYCLQQYQR